MVLAVLGRVVSMVPRRVCLGNSVAYRTPLAKPIQNKNICRFYNVDEYSDEDIDEMYAKLPSCYSLKDRKRVNVLPELNNKGITPVLQDTQWLVPKLAAHDCLEVIEKNKMMILGVHSFSVEGKDKVENVEDHRLDMENLIQNHMINRIFIVGSSDELAGKCVTAASDFLYSLDNKKNTKDLHYVSFITTETWGGEEESNELFDEDESDSEYQLEENQ